MGHSPRHTVNCSLIFIEPPLNERSAAQTGGYDGYVGLEYRPTVPSAQSFARLGR